MSERIPTSVLSIIEAKQLEGEKLTTLICRMTGLVKPFTTGVIYPGEKELQIKEIFKNDDGNYSVKVKGISFKNCKRFSIITPKDMEVRFGKRAYFMPKDFHSKDFYNGEYNITGGYFSGYRIFNKDKNSAVVKRVGNLYSVDFPFRAPLIPGGEYNFENKSGFKGDMKLVYPDNLNKKDLSLINKRMEKFRSKPGIKGIYSIILRTDGYVRLPYFLDEDFDGAIPLGNGRAMEREYLSAKNKILKQSKASGGSELKTVSKKLGINREFFNAIVDNLIKDGLVEIVDGYISYRGEERSTYLSPLGKEAYKLVEDGKSKGVSVRTIKNPGLVRCFQELERMDLAISLDRDLYFSLEGFSEILVKIFQDKRVGDTLTIQEVRDSSDLSRRYIISLFKILEDRGLIDREVDDERVIKATP